MLIWIFNRNMGSPTYCCYCGKKKRIYDRIPVIGYIISYGNCRYCKKPTNQAYLVVEVVATFAMIAALVVIGYDNYMYLIESLDNYFLGLYIITAILIIFFIFRNKKPTIID
jgi:prepilin signal peptidase PulO-like enzyme (type II secretory pathway)